MNAYPPTEKKIVWKMVEETGEITLYERWVKVNEDLEVRERKGIFTVDCPAETAVQFISNADLASTWMKGVTDSYVISKTSDSDWYAYTFYNIPWPFDNRDLVSRYTVTSDESSGSTVIWMQSVDGILAEKDDVQRIVNFYGSWEITRLGANKAKVVFTARTDTPPAYPRWIQDPVVKKAFIGNLEKLRELLNTQLVQGD
jgi:hypothetical protein